MYRGTRRAAAAEQMGEGASGWFGTMLYLYGEILCESNGEDNNLCCVVLEANDSTC